MELSQLCARLGLSEAATEAVNKAAVQPPEELLVKMRTFGQAEEGYRALAAWLGPDPKGFRMLYCQLLCALDVLDAYRALGLPEEVFWDTFGCFRRFLGETLENTGVLAFDRGWCLPRQLSMSLFRLGQLEFQFRQAEGRWVVAMHIPSDAVFTPQAVDDALGRSRSFFARYYPDRQGWDYYCRSWLLSPALAPLLPADSNILSFQRRFRLLREDVEDKGVFQWLFSAPLDADPASLPEKTGLQRRAKALLCRGGQIGAGVGILKKGNPGG